MRIILTGLIGSIPLAGLTFHYLQYLLGLKDLGHDVLYLEDTGAWCYDPATDGMVEASNRCVGYLAEIMNRHDCGETWAFIDQNDQHFGVSENKLQDYLSTSDLFINVTGAGLVRDKYLAVPVRAYVDTDPGFVQLRIANGSEHDRNHLARHSVFYTFGCNTGGDACSIPTVDIDWIPTVQPVCSRLWPKTPIDEKAPFTTIMKWKSYSPETHNGVTYGLKDMELQKYLGLPRRVCHAMELAIGGGGPEHALRDQGWRIRNALEVSCSIDSYRDYIQRSLGEWSIAKNAYVAMRSGWFSERSACYLASGRPVVVQETGFSDWLQVNDYGVVPFSSAQEAAEGIGEVLANYPRHAAAAIDVVEEYFSAPKVLNHMLDFSGA